MSLLPPSVIAVPVTVAFVMVRLAVHGPLPFAGPAQRLGENPHLHGMELSIRPARCRRGDEIVRLDVGEGHFPVLETSSFGPAV